ncbi:hypothetical protein [Halorhodospira halophila]|uniref:hypothetical protein n=1 Tax=Halorhodospira halophila TaxID=1053 RepID=UPI0019112F80|nr:hypothetical protein [Halorhodospira halophila]MBK5935492.1 hypothetical protein [Halorhodospira halophila]
MNEPHDAFKRLQNKDALRALLRDLKGIALQLAVRPDWGEDGFERRLQAYQAALGMDAGDLAGLFFPEPEPEDWRCWLLEDRLARVYGYVVAEFWLPASRIADALRPPAARSARALEASPATPLLAGSERELISAMARDLEALAEGLAREPLHGRGFRRILVGYQEALGTAGDLAGYHFPEDERALERQWARMTHQERRERGLAYLLDELELSSAELRERLQHHFAPESPGEGMRDADRLLGCSPDASGRTLCGDTLGELAALLDAPCSEPASA